MLAVTLTLTTTPALADLYIKVDANGNAISGAIVCDAATCGEGSLYSQLTLQEGERYVKQNVVIDTPIAYPEQNNTVVTPPVQPVISETTTVISDTATVLTDTSTVTTVESITATVTESVTVQDVIKKINALLVIIFQLLAKIGA